MEDTTDTTQTYSIEADAIWAASLSSPRSRRPLRHRRKADLYATLQVVFAAIEPVDEIVRAMDGAESIAELSTAEYVFDDNPNEQGEQISDYRDRAADAIEVIVKYLRATPKPTPDPEPTDGEPKPAPTVAEERGWDEPHDAYIYPRWERGDESRTVREAAAVARLIAGEATDADRRLIGNNPDNVPDAWDWGDEAGGPSPCATRRPDIADGIGVAHEALDWHTSPFGSAYDPSPTEAVLDALSPAGPRRASALNALESLLGVVILDPDPDGGGDDKEFNPLGNCVANADRDHEVRELVGLGTSADTGICIG